MTDFVLVHGAWSGSYRWRKTRPVLTHAGHNVFSPTLSGLADREHLLSREINLTTHINDVVKLVEFEDLRDIVLVGHSYGGAVVSGAADRIADRIAHLVYVDAFVLNDGQSLYSMGGGRPANGAERAPDEWLAPPMGNREWASDAERDWNTARRRPQPAACFSEPVHLAMPLEQRDFTRTFILAGADGDTGFRRIYDEIKDNPKWRTHVFEDARHMIPETHVPQLTEVLLSLVAAKATA
jgi:pimeloyl-ACP methyl ester carboxylesterase